ncbi:MAG: hypothetical protein ACRCTI_16875 [Beijerinckiaceae bacterium]
MMLKAATGLALWVIAAMPAWAQANESYGVFCARGRIVVDSRSADQMQSGQGACQLARFPDRSSAEVFARRNFGGVGGSCSCR